MERYWKWLMHANARALFFAALLALLLVLAWCAWVTWRPARAVSAENTTTEFPATSADMTLGILACLSNELANSAGTPPPDNPFRPTLESLAANREPVETVLQPRGRRHGGTNDDPFATSRAGRRVPTVTPPQPPATRVPMLTYQGYFKRSDGTTAALFYDSTSKTTTFRLPGETVHGLTLLTADKTHVRVRLPGGQELDLVVGAPPIALPEETQP